jgi:oxygen-independent coproporphyrinogen-3 oxidase
MEQIQNNNRDTSPLSLYFHLPFCETLCWFCGCTTVITKDHGRATPYLDRVEREVAEMAARMHPERSVVQMHLGGGTPTFLTPDELRRLGTIVSGHFNVSAEVEASVEIDPRRLTRDHLAAMAEGGFNRVSMGVQDFDPQVQEAVHRIQPPAMTRQAIDWSRELGYTSLNLDLIYGLPYQTEESFARSLELVLELEPDRLAVFSYAHVPWIKPAQKILEKKVLPTPEAKLNILKQTIERLTDAGMVYIGMDHFAKADDELAVAQRNKSLQRNFQGYSTRANADIYGFGMSSISQAGDAYWQTVKGHDEYMTQATWPPAKAYLLTAEDEIRRETIMRLMCDLELNYAAMSKRLGIDFAKHFADAIGSFDDMESDSLVARDADGLTVTGTGRLLIRNIAMRFDAYLQPEREGKFSRTI